MPTPTDRMNYAATLLGEAASTENEGVRSANKENAVLCLLAAAKDLAVELGTTKTAKAADTAWYRMLMEGNSL